MPRRNTFHTESNDLVGTPIDINRGFVFDEFEPSTELVRPTQLLDFTDINIDGDQPGVPVLNPAITAQAQRNTQRAVNGVGVGVATEPLVRAIEAGLSQGLSTTAPRNPCLLYTSPSPRDATLSRMPSSA